MQKKSFGFEGPQFVSEPSKGSRYIAYTFDISISSDGTSPLIEGYKDGDKANRISLIATKHNNFIELEGKGKDAPTKTKCTLTYYLTNYDDIPDFEAATSALQRLYATESFQNQLSEIQKGVLNENEVNELSSTDTDEDLKNTEESVEDTEESVEEPVVKAERASKTEIENAKPALLQETIYSLSDLYNAPTDHYPLMTTGAPIGGINALTLNIMSKIGPFGFDIQANENEKELIDAIFTYPEPCKFRDCIEYLDIKMEEKDAFKEKYFKNGTISYDDILTQYQTMYLEAMTAYDTYAKSINEILEPYLLLRLATEDLEEINGKMNEQKSTYLESVKNFTALNNEIFVYSNDILNAKLHNSIPDNIVKKRKNAIRAFKNANPAPSWKEIVNNPLQNRLCSERALKISEIFKKQINDAPQDKPLALIALQETNKKVIDLIKFELGDDWEYTEKTSGPADDKENYLIVTFYNKKHLTYLPEESQQEEGSYRVDYFTSHQTNKKMACCNLHFNYELTKDQYCEKLAHIRAGMGKVEGIFLGDPNKAHSSYHGGQSTIPPQFRLWQDGATHGDNDCIFVSTPTTISTPEQTALDLAGNPISVQRPVMTNAQQAACMPGDFLEKLNEKLKITFLQKILEDTTEGKVGIPCFVSYELAKRIHTANALGTPWELGEFKAEESAKLSSVDKQIISTLETIKNSSTPVNNHIRLLPISVTPSERAEARLEIDMDEIEQFVHEGGTFCLEGSSRLSIGNVSDLPAHLRDKFQARFQNNHPLHHEINTSATHQENPPRNPIFNNLEEVVSRLPESSAIRQFLRNAHSREVVFSDLDYERILRAELHALQYSTHSVDLSDNVKKRRIRKTLFPVTWFNREAKALQSTLRAIEGWGSYTEPVQTRFRSMTDKLAYRLLEYANHHEQDRDIVRQVAYTLLQAKCKLDLTRVIDGINSTILTTEGKKNKNKKDQRLISLLASVRNDINFYKLNNYVSIYPQSIESVKDNYQKIQTECASLKGENGVIHPVVSLVDGIINSTSEDRQKITRICALSQALYHSKNKENKKLAEKLKGKFLTAEVLEACDRSSLTYKIQHILTDLLDVKTNFDPQKADLIANLSRLLGDEQANDDHFLSQRFNQYVDKTLADLKHRGKFLFTSRLQNFLLDVRDAVPLSKANADVYSTGRIIRQSSVSSSSGSSTRSTHSDRSESPPTTPTKSLTKTLIDVREQKQSSHNRQEGELKNTNTDTTSNIPSASKN